MKKLHVIFIIFTIILGLLSTSIYASNTTLSLNGSNDVIKGTTNKITVHLNSDVSIGGIDATLEKSNNISNITITAKNGWNLITYNEENGKFNMVKNDGAQNEDVLEIEYTVSNDKGTGKIQLKDIVVSDIQDYNEIELGTIYKEMNIVEKEQPEPQPQPDPQPDTQPDTQPDPQPTPEPQPQSDDSKGETNQNTQNNKTQGNSSQKTVNKNYTSTSGEKVLPKTGIEGTIIFIAIIIVCAVTIGMYIKYKKYKGIK